MNQEKILLQIESEIIGLRTFIKKLTPEEKLHQLDIDLLRQKVRSIYDSVLMLETYPKAVPKATLSDIKQQQSIVEPEDEHDESFQAEKIWNETKADILNAEDLITKSDEEEEIIVKDVEKGNSQDDFKNAEEIKKEEPDNNIEVTSSSNKKKIEEIKDDNVDKDSDTSTKQPDLFSSNSETLADKLSEKTSPTLADRLTKSTLESLKKFIGINEKFLFINELFNGDMRNYNIALDELDSLKTIDGAKTYLFELKIQNQWQDDNEAYIKLKELIEYKFRD
jgi:hypothetical protein